MSTNIREILKTLERVSFVSRTFQIDAPIAPQIALGSLGITTKEIGGLRYRYLHPR